MNTKRQTIWLVSMLSLMVVLSAYYLFTEDVSKLDLAAQNAPQEQVTVDTKEAGQTTGQTADKAADKAAAGQTAGQPADKAAGSQTTDKAAADKAAADKAAGTQTTDKAAADKAAGTQTTDKAATDAKTTDKAGGAAKTDTGAKDAKSPEKTDAKATAGQTDVAAKDAEVLKQLESQTLTGEDFFADQILKRNANLQKLTDQYLGVITDEKTNTESLTKAYDELQKVDQQQAKLTHLEELLAKDYGNALVKQEDSKWKIYVQAAKLERSQALSILDLVMTEMNLGPESVSVNLVR